LVFYANAQQAFRLVVVIAHRLNITRMHRLDAVNMIFKSFLLCYGFILFDIFQVTRVTYLQPCSSTYMCFAGLNLVCSGSQCICITGYYWNGASCGKIQKFLALRLSFRI
jgi:hypothetical protein